MSSAARSHPSHLRRHSAQSSCPPAMEADRSEESVLMIVRRPLFVLAGILMVSMAVSADAATIDVVAGEVAIAENGRCSLREAIINANDGAETHGDCTGGSAGADTIVLPSGATFTLTDAAVLNNFGNTGLPFITSTITIQGNGSTITRDDALICNIDGTRAADEFRIVFIDSGADLTLEDVTLTNGCADGAGDDRYGAGIYNRGTLTVLRSTLSGHQARISGGGILHGGGTALVEASTLSGNSAGAGGGIAAHGGTVTVRNSTLSGNSAGNGGGVQVAQFVTVTLENVTFSANTESNLGGGVHNSRGTVNAKNTIFDGSSCVQVVGGFWNAEGANFDSGTTCSTLFGSNFTSNATLNLGPLADNGGPTMTHALLSGSAAIDAVPDGQCTRRSSATTIDVDQRGIARPQDGDRNGVSLCDAGAFEVEFIAATTPQTIPVDIDALGAGVVEIDGADGLCSLREAIDNANDTTTGLVHPDCEAGFPGGADTIVLPNAATFTLPDAAVLNNFGNTGLPFITSTITIQGNGSTITRDGTLDCTPDATLSPSEFRIFTVTGGADLTIEDATLTNGCAGGDGGDNGTGGAILNVGSLTVRRTTLSNNRATQFGGALISSGAALVEASTLSGNSAGLGGGIIANVGTVTVRNSTLSGNSAGLGGGVFVGATVTLENVTFSANTGSGGGGGIFNEFGTVNAKNTIFDGSSCVNQFGTWTAAGANFDSGTTCSSEFGSNFTANATLNLGSLAGNGGPTMTHALLSGSPAIDAVPDGQCTRFGSATTIDADQRGIARPQDGDRNGVALCDAGAFEVEFIAATTPQTIPVDTDGLGAGVVEIDGTDGLCSLREAIDNANDTATGLVHADCEAGFPGGDDTIVLPSGAIFTLPDAAVLNDAPWGNTGLPHITSTITIVGNGSTITRDDSLICTINGTRTDDEFRIFFIAGGADLTLEDVTLTNGCADGTGADRDGAGIYNRGTLTVRRSTVSGNSALRGGGIFAGGTNLVEASTLNGNSASEGGGIATFGPLTVRNSTLSGNSAVNGGGVYWVAATVTLENVTFSANTASGSGGGVFTETDLGRVNAKNTILDNSSCGDLFGGHWFAEGANFDSGTTCSTLFGSNFTESATLNLGPLAGNGGSTMTHALLSGSPAIDAATDCTTWGGGASVPTDQRGEARPQGSACDAGAFEVAQLTIDDVTRAEGTNGTTTFTFTISRGTATVGDATVQVDTANGTAAAPADYTAISGQTVTIPDGATSATVGVTVIADAIDEPDETFFVDLSNATNGVIADAQGVGTILDDDTAGIVVSKASVTTTEAGGIDSFTVVLTSQPEGNVVIDVATSDPTEGRISTDGVTQTDSATLTFTAANWSTPQTVTVHGQDDAVADGDQPYTITLTMNAATADAIYLALDPADVSATNQDDDGVGVIVSPTAGLTTTEAGGSSQFTIVLAAQPLEDVAIDLSSSDTTEGTVLPESVTFTSGNWNTARTITVTGVDDDVDDGDVAYTIITSATSSADAAWHGLAVADVSVTNIDNDTAGVVVTPTAGLTTTEAGATATFTIVLTSEPVADVIIDLSSSNPNEGLPSPASVTFTAADWNLPQTVTVTGVDDDVADGDIAYTIITSDAVSTDPKYDGMVVADVSVTNLDDESPGIAVSPTSGLTTTEAGSTASFTVVLTSQPTADVVIGLSSSDTSEGTVLPESLTFTSLNWNDAQTVTVTGVDDFIDDGDQPYTIVTANAVSADLGYNGMLVSNVSVTNLDDDTAGVTVTPTGGLVTTEAGGTDTFTLVLSSEPLADVVITLTSSDPSEGTVSPISVTFTPAGWNVAQTATITGVDDLVADGDQPYTIVTEAASADPLYDGINVADVSVTNTDDEASGVLVTPTSGLVTTEAGGTAIFTIVLTSQPTADVTIGLSSSDTTEGTVSPTSVTFTSANWNVPRTITVTGVDDDVADGDQAYTIVTTDATSTDPVYDGAGVSNVGVTNLDDDTPGIVVTPTSGLVTTEAGGTDTFTIVLTSQPTANVTIGLSSSDTTEGTVSPASVTFTAGDWNVAQTVTVTGVDDDVADGDQPYTIITAAAVSADGNYSGRTVSNVSVTNRDDDGAGIVVVPTSGLVTTEAGGSDTFTIVLTSQPTADVVIGLSSSETSEGTVSPASVTFTSANWNVAQTVTVTGVDDLIADGDQPYTIITAPAVSADPAYSGLDAPDVSVTNLDDDSAAGILVSPTAGLVTTEAGGSDRFTIVLISQSTADVVIGLSSSDTSEGTVSPASVTFTAVNWNVPQTVTVTGADDDIADGNQPYTIVAAATSADPGYDGAVANVSVTNLDDDVAGVVVHPTSGLVTTEVGGTDTFTMVLTSEPVAGVVIELHSSDSSEGVVSPSMVTFTAGDWSVPQTVTVTGVDDFEADGDQPYTIVTSRVISFDPVYHGMSVADVSVTNLDDESTAGDRDGDGIPDEVEDEGPNGGDGNGDGIADSAQENVATFPAANGNGWITIVASCPLREVEALVEGDGVPANPAVDLPFAVVAFRMPCATAEVEVLFHEQQSWPPMSQYLKYGPVVPGNRETAQWYVLPGVELDTTAIGGIQVARARFTLADGETGDATGPDGWIVDPGGPAVPARRIVPVVGSVAGQQGSLFRTAVQLHNPLDERIEGRVVFVRDGDAEGAEVSYVLEPGETISIADLLPAMGTEGLGSADVVVTGGGVPVSVVRIFNDGGEAGTAGMTAPALALTEVLRAGQSGSLIAPPEMGRSRFNIGIRTLEPAVVTMRVRNAAGVEIHEATRSFPAQWFEQRTAAAFTGVELSGDDSIAFTIVEGSAIIYGATTDNTTQDPSLQIAVGPPSGERRILPVVGSLAGRHGSLFRTAVQLHNPGEERIEGRIVFRSADGEAGGELSYALEPGETVSIADLLPEMGREGLGSAEMVATTAGVPLSVVRIFNDGGASGTAGMTVETLAPVDALGAGETGVLIAPADPAAMRFNVGIRTEEATRVTMRMRDRTGSVKQEATWTFPAGHFEQQAAEAFTGVELAGDDTIAFTIEEGRAVIYGATTDNITQDPSLQLARPAH